MAGLYLKIQGWSYNGFNSTFLPHQAAVESISVLFTCRPKEEGLDRKLQLDL